MTRDLLCHLRALRYREPKLEGALYTKAAAMETIEFFNKISSDPAYDQFKAFAAAMLQL